MPTLGERIVKAWNAFRNKDPTPTQTTSTYTSYSSTYRPDRIRPKIGSERSIILPILNRIAVDCAAVDIRHVQLDEQKRYSEDVEDDLNNILTVEANRDQTARAFRKDVFMSLLDEGEIAICPITADVNYNTMRVNKIQSVRIGKILAYRQTEIDVEMFNEETNQKEQTTLPKSICGIVQNPFYDIMNTPNSLVQRLRRKLAILDQLDEKTASGKMDMIIQLPYSTRSETQKERAQQRRTDLEEQLAGSRYGIGYIDSSEKVIQLGKPLENNLQNQIDGLTKQLHDQLGISPEILNGNASELAKLNYNNQIIEPIVSALTDELNRKWLSLTARTQGHRIMSFMNGFRVVPVTEVAKLGDTLLRNQILTPNEMRQILGFKPMEQPNADMLMNPNMPVEDQMGLEGQLTDPYGNPINPEDYGELPEDESQEVLDEENQNGS